MQCTATSKRTGERCRAQAITGRRICRHHGGRGLAGPAHPKFRDGRYSKAMPSRLLETCAASLADPERLALSDELALVDTRINALLGQLDQDADDRATWREIVGLIERRRRLVVTESTRQRAARALRAVTKEFVRLTGQPGPDSRSFS